MTRALLLAGAACVALTVSAGAADLYRAPPPPAVTTVVAPLAYNWTGFYIGVSGGGTWGRSDHIETSPGFALSSSRYDVNGYLIGGTLGYNYQMGPWVLGLEGDVSYAHIRDGLAGTGFTAGGIPATAAFNTRIDWLSTVPRTHRLCRRPLAPLFHRRPCRRQCERQLRSHGRRPHRGWLRIRHPRRLDHRRWA